MNSVRHIFLIATAVLVLTFWFTPPSLAQSSAANELSRRVSELYQAGRYAEAIPLAQRALAVREKALGPNNPAVATDLGWLALLYYSQRRYAEAEPLLKRALAIQEKAFGPDHPDVATALNGLGKLYYTQGRYSEAEPLFKRALAIQEKAFGPDHPDVATALNSLGELYEQQGRPVEFIADRWRLSRQGADVASSRSREFWDVILFDDVRNPADRTTDCEQRERRVVGKLGRATRRNHGEEVVGLLPRQFVDTAHHRVR
jgi:tetratricopeptide (TPR) repeat protein